MIYDASNIDSILNCSICNDKFTEVVKLIPWCGNSICGECYEELKDDASESKQYKCMVPACGKYHMMLDDEMPDNIGLMALLKSKRIEKPLGEQAKLLKTKLAELKEMLKNIESFNEKDQVDLLCKQLSSNVREAAESALKHIKEIENDLLGQIEKNKKKLLNSFENVHNPLGKNFARMKNGETDLVALVESLNEQWASYFNTIEIVKSDNEIQKAIDLAGEYYNKMMKLEKERNEFLNKMHFKANENFFQEKDHIGVISNEFNLPSDETIIDEKPVHTLVRHEWLTRLAFLPNNRLASCGDNKTVMIWDTKDGRKLDEFKCSSELKSICYLSLDILASGSKDGTIKIWDLNKKAEIRTLRGHTREIVSLKALTVYLASLSLDDTIKIWNPYFDSNNLILTIPGHGNNSWDFSLSLTENQELVSCSRGIFSMQECVLKVWNTTDGRLIKSVSTKSKQVASMIVLSNHQVAVAVQDATIRIIDLDDDSKSKVLAKKEPIKSSFGLFGSALLNINLVELTGGKLLRTFVESIDIWNVNDGCLIQSFSIKNCIKAVSVSRDGKLLASGDQEGLILIWKVIN